MTPKQQEIKVRLDLGMGAREIAEELGISRNAVYQQIQRMRHQGVLPTSFTPTGQPPREGYSSVGSTPRLQGVTDGTGEFDPQAFVEAFLANEQRRKQLVRELSTIASRLQAIAAEMG